MPTVIISFKKDDRSMAHLFFGPGKASAEEKMRGHAEICPKYGPAFRNNETVEFLREIEELPPSDPDELEEWVDDLLAAEGADDDETIDMVPE
jgi:hypothetical protein